MARSLKDDIAELLGPARTHEVDAEQSIFGDAAKLTDVDDAQLASLPGLQRRRLHADIQLEDEAYRGKRTSVKSFQQDAALMGSDDEQEEGSEEQSEDDGLGSDVLGFSEDEFEQGSDEQAVGSSEEEEEQPAAANGTAAARKVPASRPAAEEEEDEEGEDGLDGVTGAGDAAADDVDALEREYEMLEAGAGQEEQLLSSKQNRKKEEEKAVAVLHQQVLYERALEFRILLQPALSGSNKLPPASSHRALQQLSARHAKHKHDGQEPSIFEQLTSSYQRLKQSATDTLNSLLEVHNELLTRAKGSTSTSQVPGSSGQQPQGSDTLWESLSSQYTALAPLRDSALDRWYSRTILSSGSAALKSTLRALNQSISAQVAAMTREPGKIITRTQLTLSTRPRQLCAPPPAAADQQDEDVDMVDQEPRDPETFDDGEFYQQLLKEFLERSGGTALAGAAASMRGVKKRKSVDRRASKGRKIRYNVQDKLVDFMAPVMSEAPQFAAQLFASLFGHEGN